MGIIEDGIVFGSLPETEAFAVHYPGYPSSTSRAIETLGGMEEIVKRRTTKTENLELRFRPEDPYCHPTFGDVRPTTGLLLKISKTKPRSECRPSEGTSAPAPELLTADIVARVHQAYRFTRMVDYQYVLAVHAAKDPKRKRNWAEMGEQVEKTGLTDIEQDDLMMLVPPLFSLKDIPEDIVLKPSSAVVSKELQKGVTEQRWEMDIEPCLALAFDIEKVPEKVNWEDHIPKGSLDWNCQVAVSRLFDERPIWPRNSLWDRLLSDGLPIRESQMRRLLARSGYYFSTGPFAKFWIRKDYDPRADPESRVYQKADFRVPITVRKAARASLARDESKVKWKDICRFQAFPTKTFTNLQFFELEDDFVQQEIRKPTQKTTCSLSTGWISRHRHEILITHVRVRFLSLLHDEVARDVLKSAKRHLERVKRLPVLEDLDMDDDEGTLENSRHASDDHGSQLLGSKTESCNLQHTLDNGDQPNSLESDSEEEEEYEPEDDELPSAVENSDFLNSPLCNTGDGISGDYLRDMLFDLQSREGTDSDHYGGAINDEYEIFEQDSENDDDY